DVSIQAQVLDLLEGLQDELGLSMLFITHNLAVAQKLCDRIIVMANGKIMETAPTDVLFGKPVHPYTRSLLAAVLPIRHDPVVSGESALDGPLDTGGELELVGPGHWVRQDSTSPSITGHRGSEMSARAAGPSNHENSTERGKP